MVRVVQVLAAPLRLIVFGLAVASLVAFAAACGDDEPASFRSVDVVLSEWEVTPELGQVQAGEVRVFAINRGSIPHDLVLIPVDAWPAELPTNPDGSVDETQIEIAGRIEAVEPGQVESGTFDLAPGLYALICNVVEDGVSHYEMDMRSSITVLE
jgi:uncharacterized cupredoxin-like copper-binding protein